jgi:NAD(P)-dependent dehydrogenase (short-subunit alcohol dehydrogenase family)
VGRLEGRRALVTGAGTGLGREIALELGREGADVVLHYSGERKDADSAAQELGRLGRQTAVLEGDFRKSGAAKDLADRALQVFGTIDLLVNNAGITFSSPFSEITSEQLDMLFEVNIKAAFRLTQEIAAVMEKHRGGAICNISSIHGLQGAAHHSAYAATKGAILGFTRALAMELGYKKIRVNAIAPGWVMVESTSALPGFDPQIARERADAKVPLTRYGTPQDVAKLVVFLCSEDSGFITGQTFVIDGGTSTLMSLLSDFRNPPASTSNESA